MISLRITGFVVLLSLKFQVSEISSFRDAKQVEKHSKLQM
jgi:hypothetical protein